jgi:hypothetical protein
MRTTPSSPGSTIDRQSSLEIMKDQSDFFNDFNSSVVDFEIEANELAIFNDLSELVTTLENASESDDSSSDLSRDANVEFDKDDDDDLAVELEELARVEGLLRKELQRQQSMSSDLGDKGSYTLYDHFKSLKLEEIAGAGGYLCYKSHLLEKTLDRPTSTLMNDVVEFCQPIHDKDLDDLYFG